MLHRPRLLLTSFFLTLACCGEADDAAQGARIALFEACKTSTECGSELCTSGLYAFDEPGYCSKRCSEDQDCRSADARGVCREVPLIWEPGQDAAMPESQKLCLSDCEQSEPGVYACSDGLRRFCADDEHADCEVCSCAAGGFCDTQSHRCEPYKHGGEACSQAGECLSEVCTNGACSAGPGDDCQHCDGICGGPDQAPYCLPACKAGRCPRDAAGWGCVTSADSAGREVCGKLCTEPTDCMHEDEVCETFSSAASSGDGPLAFSGLCHGGRASE